MDEQVAQTDSAVAEQAPVQETPSSLLQREETVSTPVSDTVEAVDTETVQDTGPTVPDSVDGYDYTPRSENWNVDEYNAFKEKALSMGLNTEQFNNALSAYEDSMLAVVEQYTQTPEKAANALQERWGNDYDSNMKFAQKAFNQLVPKELDQRIGNNPDVIEMLAHIGKQLGEDSGPSSFNSGSKSSGMSKLEIEDFMKAPDYWTNKEKQRIVSDWYASR